MPHTKTLLTKIILFAGLNGAAFAQLPLSTIQDVLFKADGARFTGTLIIQWNTFDANHLGTVVQQSKTVSVLNGNLQIQLAPNQGARPPANTYTVSYQSDGLQQSAEIWTVPSSSAPLTVPQVRVGSVVTTSGGSSSSFAAAGSSGTGNTTIAESAVVGLLSDLSQRPTKGPGFGTGAVAVINPSGQVETAVGTLGDCVFVDGTTGPCGGPTPTFSDAEVPAGTIDGVNTAFTLQNSPSGSSLLLVRNGLYLIAGADYTLNGNAVTFINGAQPQPGDTLRASYRVNPSGQIRQFPGSAVTQVICNGAGRSSTNAVLGSLGGCDIPASVIQAGDRFEVRFTFSKPGTGSAYDVAINWGSTNVLTRHANAQDTAFTGKAEAAIGASGAQISVESWGVVLTLLPGIVSSPSQNGVRVDFLGKLSTAGTDTLTLMNFTVLHYPAN
jgi:hypothetical protein